jgi:glycine cleavage system H protein
MEQEEGLRFDEKHLWVREDGDEIIIGISQYLADQLGPLAAIELPDEGAPVFRGDSFGTIEHSNEVVEDLVGPLGGEVLRVNEDLLENPELIKDDPYGDGWLLALDADEGFDSSTLMTFDQYEEYVEALEEEDEEFEDDFDDEDDLDVFSEDFEDEDY